jgi:hypothetical protein
MKKATPLLYVAGGAALIFALCASDCETSTEFPGFVTEKICTDNIDNDSDGVADCLDSDCDQACQVQVSINTPGVIIDDALALTGTVHNATTITIVMSPTGEADPVQISGETWSTTVRNFTSSGTYRITATATSAQGKSASDTASVTK